MTRFGFERKGKYSNEREGKCSHEREGKCSHFTDSEEFNEVIRYLDLIDLPLNGRQLIWTNKREIPSFAKLDRFLLNKDGSLHFLFLFRMVYLILFQVIAYFAVYWRC